jgi:hypothetical protein
VFRIRIRSGLEWVSGSSRQAKIVPEKMKKIHAELSLLLELECPDSFVGVLGHLLLKNSLFRKKPWIRIRIQQNAWIRIAIQ